MDRINLDGKDGLKRNLAKFFNEFIDLHNGMKPHWKRFFKSLLPPNWMDSSHAYTNLWTEAGEIANYTMAHIHAIFYPMLIILLIV